MKEYPDVTDIYRRKEANRKDAAKRPLSEKMAIASRLREVQERLAPVRAANKDKRASNKIRIRISTIETPKKLEE